MVSQSNVASRLLLWNYVNQQYQHVTSAEHMTDEEATNFIPLFPRAHRFYWSKRTDALMSPYQAMLATNREFARSVE